jgi:hypothetical protein
MDDESNDVEGTALDEFLVNALKDGKDRIFLLKLDRELCSFLNNPAYAFAFILTHVFYHALSLPSY